jgi:pyruvate dehydrogenase E2 component (dihydrolipoamide acetyltransferase)
VLTGIARASRVESLAPWLKRLTATPDGISWDFAKAAMLSRNDPAMRAAQVELAETLFPDGVQGFDVTKLLERVSVPTAIIWGRSDHVIPWKHVLAARGEMALHLLPQIGHIPYVESPGLVAEVLARNIGRPGRD